MASPCLNVISWSATEDVLKTPNEHSRERLHLSTARCAHFTARGQTVRRRSHTFRALTKYAKATIAQSV